MAERGSVEMSSSGADKPDDPDGGVTMSGGIVLAGSSRFKGGAERHRTSVYHLEQGRRSQASTGSARASRERPDTHTILEEEASKSAAAAGAATPSRGGDAERKASAKEVVGPPPMTAGVASSDGSAVHTSRKDGGSGSTNASIQRGSSSIFFQPRKKGRRRLARALYGMSDREYRGKVIAEQLRLAGDGNGRRVVHPDSPFRVYWDLCAIFLVVYTSMLLPYRIAFLTAFQVDGWFAFGIVEDLFFLVDLVLNFRTGVYIDGVLVMHPDRIRHYYLRHMFIFDFVAALPVDYVSLGFDSSGDDDQAHTLLRASRALRVLRLFKLVRLFRISRLFRYLSRYADQFNSNYVRIFKMMFLLLLFSHWNACLLFVVSSLEEFPDESWVAMNNLVGADAFTQYSNSLFNALSHMLCIGYGRFPPQLISEVWMTIWSMLSGASLFAGIIGAISALMLNADTAGEAFRARRAELLQFMIKYNLKESLRDRMFAHFAARWSKHKVFNEASLMSDLPTPLQREVQLQKCANLIAHVPLFQDADHGFISSMVMRLHWQYVLANEDVVIERQPPTDLFFISTGVVGMFRKTERVATLSEGSYFGEMSLLWGHKQPMTVRTLQDCQLYSMCDDEFHEVMLDYPDVVSLMKEIARQRMKRLHIPDSWAKDEDGTIHKRSDLLRLQSFFTRTQHGSMQTLRHLFELDDAGSQLSPRGAGSGVNPVYDGSMVSAPDVGGASAPADGGDAAGPDDAADADAPAPRPTEATPGPFVVGATTADGRAVVELTPLELRLLRELASREVSGAEAAATGALPGLAGAEMAGLATARAGDSSDRPRGSTVGSAADAKDASADHGGDAGGDDGLDMSGSTYVHLQQGVPRRVSSFLSPVVGGGVAVGRRVSASSVGGGTPKPSR